nr:hypothetical protein [Tanacetum cinerariifolium]
MELTVFFLPSDGKVGVEVSVVDLQVSAVRLFLLLLVQKFLLFGLTNWCCSLNAVRKQVGDLSSHSTKYTSPALTQKEVGKDVDEVHAEDVNAAVNEPSIPSPTPPTPPPQPSQDISSTSQAYFTAVSLKVYAVWSDELFRTSVTVKKVNDVTRLQALVNKKKVVITEATIREALRLDDAEGVECFPNEEIFAELARMGYEKPSTKLTFYKAFFLRTALSGVETPLSERMIVEQQVVEGANEVHDKGVPAAGIVAEGDVSAANDEVPTAVEEPSIPSPTPPTPPPQPSRDIPSTSQAQLTPPQSPQVKPKLPQKQPQPSQDARISIDLLQNLMDTSQRIDTSDDTVMDDVSKQDGIIANIDADEDVVLEDAKNVVADAKDGQDANVDESVDIQGRTAESQAQIYKIDLEHANKVLSMQDEEELEPAKLQEVVDIVTTAKIITEVVTAASTTIIVAADVPIPAATTGATLTLTAAPSRRTKGVVIRDPEESATPSTIIHSEAKSKDKGKGILVEEPKPLKKQAQIEQDEKYARELEAELNRNTEAQARKNMMIYLKNVVCFKMDYFKGMYYDDIRPVFEKYFDSNVAFLQNTKEQMDEEDSEALKRLNESQKEKAAKKQKLEEEVEELKRHLRIVLNDEDDVYTEATPLDRKDLEALWSLVKERFATTKPKNFSNDFLLITLGAMFERPDIHAQFWKNQRSVHGQAKMLNNVRLEVEEESEISLKLLSFGVDAAIDFNGKHAKCLMLLVKDLVLPRQDDVIITKATIRDALRLDDAESIDCLPNEEIFIKLSRMGYEKPSTKLTFYKAFFSPQWKVGKGFSGVDTPFFKGMIVAQQVDESAAEVNVDDVPAVSVADEGVADVNTDVDLTAIDEPSIPSPPLTTKPLPPSQDVPSTSQDKIAQDLEITKLKQRVKKLERRNKLKVSKLRRLKKLETLQRVDTSDNTVMDDVSKQERIIASMDAGVDVTLRDVVDITNATITVATPTLTTIAAPTLTTALSAARRRKGIVIRDPKETATPSIIIHYEAKSKDKGKGILCREREKKDNALMRYQALKRKPQTKAQARKNMMIYLRNMDGFKMDYFKGMKYDNIHSRALKRISESQEDKAAKKQKLDEEVAELKRHLQIVPNDEDDVYTKATPLAQKLVKERFASSKPKNFSDDFLLTTLTYMFKKPDVQAQMILLVKKRYLLSRFTLDQMLNNVRLEVEEESEVSLEPLRFVRQQQQEGFRPE